LKNSFFTAFFAIKPSQVQERVIISPLIYPNQVEAAVKDLIALLPATKCREVIFLGAIGGPEGEGKID
jgi:hypothetical protein